MNPEALIQAGDLDGALALAKESVRTSPSDPKQRIALFQVECLFGHWAKAGTQLEVLGELGAESAVFARVFSPVLECEMLREEIFSGRRTPIIFGEPQDWMGWLVEAGRMVADGEFEAAEGLRSKAFEAAEAVPGTINGRPFEWMADSDLRLGPMFEVIMDGCYRWVPMCRVEAIQFDPPKDLRDLVWFPARLRWTNGGLANGFLPVRYPGTERREEASLRLSRRTEWDAKPHGFYAGSGQRMFSIGDEEIPLLDVREILFGEAPAASETPSLS